MQVCNDEEADARKFVHVRDAVKHSAQKEFIRTVDTDEVVVLLQSTVTCA